MCVQKRDLHSPVGQDIESFRDLHFFHQLFLPSCWPSFIMHQQSLKQLFIIIIQECTAHIKLNSPTWQNRKDK